MAKVTKKTAKSSQSNETDKAAKKNAPKLQPKQPNAKVVSDKGKKIKSKKILQKVGKKPNVIESVKDELVKIVDTWSSAFWRIWVPSNLLSMSTIDETIDESAYVISAELFYGLQRGERGKRPYDHSEVKKITDFSKESLWLYSRDKKDQIPSGFKSSKQKSGYIPLGSIQKCNRCKGSGRVVCYNCNGTGQVRRTDSNNRSYWDTCRSCDGGTNQCYKCSGYGWLQDVIETTTEYNSESFVNTDYEGAIPIPEIHRVSGLTLLEEVFEYPVDKVKKMLVGGINSAEYEKLQDNIKDQVYFSIKSTLSNYEGDIKLLYDSIETFFKTVPNPIEKNKVFEIEMLPIRIKIKVQRKETYRIEFRYKGSQYSINVFGAENLVHYQKGPREHTIKATVAYILLAVSSLLLVVYLVTSSS